MFITRKNLFMLLGLQMHILLYFNFPKIKKNRKNIKMFSFLGNFFFSNKYKKFYILTDRFSINCEKFFRAGIKKNSNFFFWKNIFFSLSLLSLESPPQLAFTCSMLTIRNTRTRCEISSKLKYVHAISHQGKVAY